MEHETVIRLSCFGAVFAGMALWELATPRRPRNVSKTRRWFNNIGVLVLGSLVVRLVYGAAAVGTALYAQDRGWGLFQILDWPYWLETALTVVLLDFVIYMQHVMFHAVPLFWRFHMMHHADLDLDVTSGTRFHPVEYILSMGIKVAAVALLGPPVAGVIIFEVLLNATSMFNHSNVYMPAVLDRFLRLLVVTPDMHRVHHSIDSSESNSNFGFNLPWWDRILGTYRAQPAGGHEGMTLGLTQFLDKKKQSLWWLLVMPFSERQGDYAINRRRFSD